MMAQHHQVWLFRHGDTEWSVSGQHTGRTDLPLTAGGRRRAQAVGRRLAGRPFARVLSSPLARALETCRLAGYGEVAELSPDLMEWDYGDYEDPVQKIGRPRQLYIGATHRDYVDVENR
jgi:probable phosphoglycerate mutase